MDPTQQQYDFLRPLVTNWLGKINLAKQGKAKEFRETAEQCMAFFAGSMGFMWEERYRKKFIGGKISPKFRLSMNKAFELVALFGPVLYHRNPVRRVQPHKAIEWEESAVAEALGIDNEQWLALQDAAQQASQMLEAGEPIPPELQEQVGTYQQASQMVSQLLRLEETERATRRVACRLMEEYLSFTPREQPNGGLEQAAEDAITEALIKGRGVLWPAPYVMPGSETKLTGNFWGSCDELLSDPDAKSMNFGDTKWIAREHLEPWWEVERRFNLPNGTLKGKGRLESSEAQVARNQSDTPNMDRQTGKSFDLVRWWEIWSIGGVGTRLLGASSVMNEAFDEVVGDYAYLCVCEGVQYPLNAPTERVREASDEEVVEMFQWPVPYYLDQRWPCAMLEFYREPGNPYPVAPLKPGLGELTFLNIVISHLTNRIWQSSRTIIAVLESARSYVEKALKNGEDLVVVGLKEIHKDLNSVISEFQHKDITYDIWRIVDRVFELFDKRVGLSDLMYAMNPGGAASRSATDMKVKEEKMSVRPDHMAKKVEQWMSEVARMEKLCAYWSGVEGRDVQPLLGGLGAMFWDRVIAAAEPELILREMDATVEAGTARKPNRDRDAANMGQLYQPLSQQFMAYAQLTGESEPLNNLNKMLGTAIEQDMSGLRMGPWASQQPDPAQQQAEMKMQVEQQKAQLDMQKTQLEMQAKMAELEVKLQAQAAEMEMEAIAHNQELRQDQEKHAQEMQLRKQEGEKELKIKEQEGKQKIALQKKQGEAMARMKRLQGAQSASKSASKSKTPKKAA